VEWSICMALHAADSGGDAHAHGAQVWDLQARVTLRRLVGHTGAVTGVAVATHGDACVSCGGDATVRLWRLEAPQMGDAAASRDGVAEQKVRPTHLHAPPPRRRWGCQTHSRW
jgi:WD40 repeat protein